MNSKVSNQIIVQKKVSRGLKGMILALFALIGILKISLGAVINVPVALLFGDLFVAAFGLIVLLAFYLMLFPLPKKKLRTTVVFLSILGLIIISSAFYAGILRNFEMTSNLFTTGLNEMIGKAKHAFSFTAPEGSYWYLYGGILGESLLLLLSAFDSWLIITLLSLVAIALLCVIFWPSIRHLIIYLGEYVREKRKRQEVLFQAGLLGQEEVKEEPVQVKVDEVIEEARTYTSSLLHPVASKTYEEPLPAPQYNEPIRPKKPYTDSLSKVTINDGEDTFTLPSLDNEDSIEAIIQTPVLGELSRVDNEDYDALQKAVDTKGTFEAITLPEDVVREEESPEEIIEDLEPTPLFVEKAEELPEVIEEKEEILLFDEPVIEDVLPVTPTPEVIKQVEPKTAPAPKEERIKRKYLNYKLPDINLLSDAVESGQEVENEKDAKDFSERINVFFRDFNIDANVASYTIGSTFTRYEISLGPTETINSIKNLMNDISLRLNGASIRFEPIIPGKALSGIEVANKHRTIVNFKESILRIAQEKKKKYYIPMGKDVAGNIIFSPFGDFPHLLVAGATGSGKSVFIHTVLTSLIMFHTPNELRLLLIDPKRVELAQYNNIPHLLAPIVKEPSEAKVALDRLIDEMERRYKLFETTSVSKFSEYNEVIEELGGEQIPLIIAIVDEFADLFESEKEVSTSVLRLVQKSRAAGIHLLIATQRPSVQVITGNIKANIPSRVAFMTASVTDSMTILGQGGAELLLGYGDMLVDSITVGRGFVRVQAPFIPVKEVLRITNYLRNTYETDFHPDFTDLKEKVNVFGNGPAADDELYPSVVAFVETQDTISISRLQQQFGLGWPRARGLYDLLVQNGVVAPPDEANSAKGAVVIINRK